MNYDFLVLGGDNRQKHLVYLLLNKGFSVACFQVNGIDDNICLPHFKDCKHIIAPIPLIKNNNILGADLSFDDIFPYLTKDHIFFSSNIPKSIVTKLDSANIKIVDYLNDASFSIFNSIATAEGAIAEAISASPFNIHKSNALVLGYGKCAKTLALKLKGLDANVYVSARSKEALSYADAFGFHSFNLSSLKDKINDFLFIFNTIPSLIINKDIMPYINKNCVLIDIASAPGGIDYNACKDFEFSARLSLGLPSKYSPATSSKAILSSILNSLKNFK